MTARVVCAGVITMDTVALVDHYPDADERVIARELVRNVGGPAAVSAITLSRLGIPSAIVGTVGADDDGHEAMRILESKGVDTSGVTVSAETRTGASVIVVSGASRAISTRQRPTQAKPSQRARELVADAEWLHVDQVGIQLVDVLGATRGHGPKVSFDAGYDVKDFDCALVDLFAPTDRQMALRHPDLDLEAGMRKDAAHGRTIVVATRGADGSAVVDPDGAFVTIPGFSVPVVSTLGAGDVFHGALVAQVVQERSWPEALRRANAVAALKCRGLDAHSAVPTAGELEAFLSEHPQ